METKWSKFEWGPSCFDPPYEISVEKRKTLEGGKAYAQYVKAARETTREIQDLPYDPSLWSKRGMFLTQLGLPELALGDLYKAKLLVDAGLKKDDELDLLGETVRLVSVMRVWVYGLENDGYESEIVAVGGLRNATDHFLCNLDQKIWFTTSACFRLLYSLEDLEAHYKQPPNCHPENEDVVKLEKRTLQPMADQVEARQNHVTGACGSILVVRAYPWMTKDLFCRDETAITSVRKHLATITSKCTLLPSEAPVSHRNVFSGKAHGVFATKDIRKGQVILVDRGVGNATNHPSRCACCLKYHHQESSLRNFPCCPNILQRPHCSQKCIDKIINLCHRAMCSKDFSFVYDATKDTEGQKNMMGNLRLLEFLAIGIQEAAEHPLKASYINQFIPDPQEKFALPFCYTDSIVIPTRILQNLGIDIFADHRYDTWVIQAMKVRIEASVIPLAHHSKEHPVTWNSAHYTLFNRNNEPNVDMELAPKRTAAEVAIVVRACRTIKKGEELTYYNEGELNEAIHAISHQREKERTGCDFYRFLRNGISWDVPLPQYIVEGRG